MTPSARVQAAIELLDEIIDAAKTKGAPADRLIANYFKQRRYAGSKDRRAVRELVYSAIRACGPVPGNGRAAMLRLAEIDPSILLLFDGSNHGPEPVRDNEMAAAGGIAPEWLTDALAASGVSTEAMEALLDRASLDVRVNTLKTDRGRIDLPQAGEILTAPHALRFPTGTLVEQWPQYRDGQIEVQDHGSQLICEAIHVAQGDTVIDLCAGAGGKTLALAARLSNEGTLVACDTDKRRLGNLAPRAQRAGAYIDHTVLLDPNRELEALTQWVGQANVVLVDAPCSGAGTWRRNPEARWRIDHGELDRLTKLQDQVLDIAAQLVHPTGHIVFVTCSLLDAEGADRIEAFLTRHGGWEAPPIGLPAGSKRGKGMRLDPYHEGTDGFFVAMLRPGC